MRNDFDDYNWSGWITTIKELDEYTSNRKGYTCPFTDEYNPSVPEFYYMQASKLINEGKQIAFENTSMKVKQ